VKQQDHQKELITTADARRRDAQKVEIQANAELRQAQSQLGDLLVQEQQRRALAAQISAQQAAAAVSRNRNAVDAAARRSAGVGAPRPGNNSQPPVQAGRIIPPPSPGGAGAVAAARSQLGVPYHWGQMSPGNGFDCSGLTAWAWAQAGRNLPHNAAAQYAVTTHIDIADIQPGDLVFFGNPIHHNGMYIGNGQMIDAPHTGAVVRIAAAFRRDLVGVGRP
jgi:cell wall-associated NlpC family hydrolase